MKFQSCTRGVASSRAKYQASGDPRVIELAFETSMAFLLLTPAMIVGDVAVVGAAMLSGGAPKSKTIVPGYVRGYDVRTGKLIWTFHTIPKLGEFGNNTWENDSWQYTGNTGVWAPISADPELGYVYLPVETPTGDYYGGNRPGNGLFGESLVALDLNTGRRLSVEARMAAVG
mgnify:CR=1 FL=1